MPSNADSRGPAAARRGVLAGRPAAGRPDPRAAGRAGRRRAARSSEERLVDEVWGPDDVPANPAKALQVVVSRARAQTAPEVVARTDHGYRLGLAPDAVDALVLRDAVVGAREAEGRHDLVRARDLARAALAFPEPGSAADGPLGELRLTAARHRAIATAVLGRALSGLGDHDEALPLLRARRAPTTRPRSRPCCARPRRCTARRPRSERLRAAPRRSRRPAGRRPRTGPPGRARRAAGGRPAGARGAAVRGDVAGRPRRGHPGAPGRGPRGQGHLDPRPRRPGQDPAGAPARPRGRTAGRALRRAGRRLLA